MKNTVFRLLASFAIMALLGACTRSQTSAIKEPVPTAVKDSAQPPAPAAEPSSGIVSLDENNFHEEVIESNLPVLLIICHKDRGACKYEKPILEALAIELAGKIKVCRVELSDRTLLVYQIIQNAGGRVPWASLPNHIAVKGGKKYTQYEGVMDANELRAWLNHAFDREPVEQLPRDTGGNTAGL